MSIVRIENLSHANGPKQLYRNSNFVINKGEHVALVGLNGTGKTTLLKIIANKITPDQGIITIQPKIKIGYLDQHQEVNQTHTVISYLRSAYEDLFNKADQIAKLYEQISENYEEKILVRALKLQDELDHSDYDLIGKKIGNLITGLGINNEILDRPLQSLSGGQRGKVLLAKLLLAEDDFLLLDEPTNFLDLDQIEWLAKFLQSYESAFLMVSHDRDFINQTCQVIYDIDNLTLTRYAGNFEYFVEQKSLVSDQYEKEYKGQQKTIKKLQTFISKNAARASTARSAQSRQKQLDKMVVLNKQKIEKKPAFNFKYKRPTTNIIVDAEQLEIGYNHPLIKPLTFKLTEGEKWIVKGFNGIGKTTFLETVAGNIPALGGTVRLGANVKLAYFSQVGKFDQETPFQYLKNNYPDLTDQQIKTTLANFGVKNNLMAHPLPTLSGGEQTKIRLALLSLVSCSLLILDEPTNHLDILAKEALLEAISKFPGTVLLTTHDINFSTNWANEVLDFETIIS